MDNSLYIQTCHLHDSSALFDGKAIEDGNTGCLTMPRINDESGLLALLTCRDKFQYRTDRKLQKRYFELLK